jgi:hypothetical protein
MSENKTTVKTHPDNTTHPSEHPPTHPTDIPPVVFVTCLYGGAAYSEGAVVNNQRCVSNNNGEGVWKDIK